MQSPFVTSSETFSISFYLVSFLFINLELVKKSVVTANTQINFVIPIVSFPKAGLLFQVLILYSL